MPIVGVANVERNGEKGHIAQSKENNNQKNLQTPGFTASVPET